MHWSAEADTSTVLLTHAPDMLPAASNLFAKLRETDARSDEQGVHFLLEAGSQTMRLVRLAGVPANSPLAVLIPLDADGPDRTKALDRLLRAGHFPAIATHDPQMIAETRRLAAAAGISSASYEFQMLYGVRRDLQASLRAEGFGMRVYIPYGREWFPYFMRRLGERPANVGFVLKSLLRER